MLTMFLSLSRVTNASEEREKECCLRVDVN